MKGKNSGLMVRVRGHTKRGVLAGGLLALGLGASLLSPGHALAGFTVCEGDPVISLSNGVQVRVQAYVADVPGDVQSVAYTVHVPQGATVNQVMYTGGPLSNKETVQVVADRAGNSYATDTVVTTGTGGIVAISTTTLTSLSTNQTLASGAAPGLNGQTLHVGLSFYEGSQ